LLFVTDSALGDYVGAIRHLKEYDRIGDSVFKIDRNRQIEELQIAYHTAEKDKSIQQLKAKEQLAQLQLRHTKSTRDWIIAAASLLLAIAALLYRQSRFRKKNNGMILEKNNQLQQLVKEKDWLVKEIHHRVKNNFQTVMGLLGTQCGYLNNESSIRAIRDSQQRIQAMSLIHQRLYSTENLSAMSMPDYVLELVDFLRDSYAIGRLVFFQLQIEPVVLDLEYCIPLGLILNEAITNSFKYAFLDANEGTISISLSQAAPNYLQLTINDNGIGLPPGFNGAQTGSMGMNLMHGLCLEIGASFSITTYHGTQITIGFDYVPESVTAHTTLHALN
jgi:two-component system, sensor histidine kinase PdtaS